MTIQRAILDTSIVIADDVAPIPGLVAISLATLAELHFGVMITADPQQRAARLKRLTYLERHLDVLPFDEVVAASYGEIAAAVQRSGRQPRSRTMDLVIAATAHAHGACVYTRNIKDFGGLEGLVDVREA